MMYETKELAEAALTKMKQGEWFCPLIATKCQVECTCFVAAYTYQGEMSDGAKTWIATESYCGNAMFSPDRNCNL